MKKLELLLVPFLLTQVLLGGCGGGGGSGDSGDDAVVGDPPTILDIDTTVNQMSESARPGAPVGLILGITPASTASVRYSLADNAGGSFAVDPVSGVVSVAGGVDFEASPVRTIVAEVAVGSGSRVRTAQQQFQIAVLDSPAPAAEITFPLAHARYGDGAISVSGFVSHAQLQNVNVSADAGGAPVQGEIANGKFHVRNIPISGLGTFTLTVTASHGGGDATTQRMTISREPELTYVPGMLLDESRSRVLLLDRDTPAIIASPLDGGPRSIVSGRHVGSGPAFVQPVALSPGPDARFVYVVDNERSALFRVDLATGDRTRLSGSGPDFLAPTELDFDPIRGLLIVSDEVSGVLTIVPTTGERRLLSSPQTPGPPIYYFRGVGFDLVRDRILVSDSSSLFAVSPTTGARTMLSDGLSDLPGSFLRGMNVVSQAGFAYVADEFTNRVARIDLASGIRQTITSSGIAMYNVPPVGSGPWLEYPEDVVIDSAGRMFVIAAEFAVPLMEIRPNGDRVVVRDASLGSGVNFRGPHGLKFDAARRVLLSADNVADFIAEIDPSNGNRTVVSGRSDGRGTIDTDPMDAAFNASTSQYYSVDFTTNALYSARAGEAPVVVSDAMIGSGPLLNNPTGIEIDEGTGVAYVMDGSVVLAIDLATGARRTLASGFFSLSGLTADLANQRLYLAEAGGNIYSVDIAAGTRRLVSSGFGTLSTADIAYDSATQNLIVARDFPAQIELIASASGTRTIVTGTAAATCGPTLASPRSVAFDTARQIAYVTDDLHDGIIAVDLGTGCRQLIAK